VAQTDIGLHYDTAAACHRRR